MARYCSHVGYGHEIRGFRATSYHARSVRPLSSRILFTAHGRRITAPSIPLDTAFGPDGLTWSRSTSWNQTGTLFALEALLLLAFPLLFTLHAFVALPEFAEASHQLQRLPRISCYPRKMMGYGFFSLGFLSAFFWAFTTPISLSRSSKICAIESGVTDSMAR